MAPTGAFVGPCVVVPDVGGRPNAYFEVKPRRKWANEFVDWLKYGRHNGVFGSRTDRKAGKKGR